MPGTASKAIAVGYPGGVAAVFDAVTCRLAYAWSGQFLNTDPVWNNRGGAPAKVLGQSFWNAPPGFPWAVAPAGESGSWTAPFPWPIVAVHMVLLPDGKVLTVGRWGTPQVWNPATGAFTSTPSPAWLFCAGHALLADGTVLFAGGHISDNHGIPDITVFSVGTGWSSQTPMALGRWYPTTTVIRSPRLRA